MPEAISSNLAKLEMAQIYIYKFDVFLTLDMRKLLLFQALFINPKRHGGGGIHPLVTESYYGHKIS